MTKKGDEGTTSLSNGKRVSKDSVRITALGSVDETNSAIGFVLSHHPVEEIVNVLKEIQNDLFNIGGEISVVDKDLDYVSEEDVRKLERAITDLNSSLPPLKEFIVPGGSPASANLHFARSICRRTERDLVSLSNHASIKPLFLKYFNRLSDFLFVAARYQNLKDGGEEESWKRR